MALNSYHRRLLEVPDVSKELSSAYWGNLTQRDITYRFDNSDGFFTALAKAEELRGKGFRHRRHEALETATDVISLEAYGFISHVDIREVAEITISPQNPDQFATLLPKKVMETADFFTETPPPPATPTHMHPAVDLGKAYALCFGYCRKVPLRYVSADYVNNRADYIIGTGIMESNNSNKATTVNVYRSKRLVTSAEYYVHGGEATIQYTDSAFGLTAGAANPYLGYAWIRFSGTAWEQIDQSGSPYEMTMDLRGMKLGGDSTATRNFARIIQNLMSNATWGLNVSINTTSFDAAAGYVSELLCDGHVSEQIAASELIEELLFCCRGRREINGSGEWLLNVDTAQQTIKATFGHKDDQYQNIIDITKNTKTPSSESVKKLTLVYRKNEWTGEYALKLERAVLPTGEERIVELNFVRDSETADRIASYNQRLMQLGDEQLGIIVGMEGRYLREMDSIQVVIPDEIYDINRPYQIRSIPSRSLNSFHLDLISYDSGIFTYFPGTLPPSDNADDTADYSNTPPDAPTSLTRVSSDTNQGTDGTTYAYVELSAVAPVLNFQQMYFGYRKQGESLPYTWVLGELYSGNTWKGRIPMLIPGISYQYAAVSENSYGMRSTVTTLNSQTSPGDTTAPAQVTGLIGKGKYKTWHYEWNKSPEVDLNGYHVQIGNSAFSVINFDRVVGGNTVDFTDDAIGYGTLYCRIKAVDFTGNESATWSASAAATTNQTQAPDIGDGQVTNPKRQSVEEQSVSFSIPALSNNQYNFYHSLTKKPIVTVSFASIFTGGSVSHVITNFSTQITVALYNSSSNTWAGTLYVQYW